MFDDPIYSSYESVGLNSGLDFIDHVVRLNLSNRKIPGLVYSKVIGKVFSSYKELLDSVMHDNPTLPEDLTLSQLKLLQMELNEIKKEREFRLAAYFCNELVDNIIKDEIKECKRLGLFSSGDK